MNASTGLVPAQVLLLSKQNNDIPNTENCEMFVIYFQLFTQVVMLEITDTKIE